MPHAKGELHGRAVLTDNAVAFIRKVGAPRGSGKDGIWLKDLADAFGVDRTTVTDAYHNNTWTHV